MVTEKTQTDTFSEFFREVEPRLRFALGVTAGPVEGREAAAAALEWAWVHWDRVQEMDNPAGYLYRVGRSSLPRRRSRPPVMPPAETDRLPWIEPGLPDALAQLTTRQRAVVLLLHGLGWTHSEVADALAVSRGSVQRHADRAMSKLRTALGVES